MRALSRMAQPERVSAIFIMLAGVKYRCAEIACILREGRGAIRGFWRQFTPKNATKPAFRAAIGIVSRETSPLKIGAPFPAPCMGKRPPAGPSCRQTRSSVFAIFATTKAITGTAVMQPVEEGKLDLDAPAKTYAPHISELQVLDGFDAGGKP